MQDLREKHRTTRQRMFSLFSFLFTSSHKIKLRSGSTRSEWSPVLLRACVACSTSGDRVQCMLRYLRQTVHQFLYIVSMRNAYSTLSSEHIYLPPTCLLYSSRYRHLLPPSSPPMLLSQNNSRWIWGLGNALNRPNTFPPLPFLTLRQPAPKYNHARPSGGRSYM